MKLSQISINIGENSSVSIPIGIIFPEIIICDERIANVGKCASAINIRERWNTVRLFIS